MNRYFLFAILTTLLLASCQKTEAPAPKPQPRQEKPFSPVSIPEPVAEPVISTQKKVTVRNGSELIKAIASHSHIYIESADTIDLYKVLHPRKPSQRLTIENIEDMTLEGHGCTIYSSQSDEYAQLIKFSNCRNITITGLNFTARRKESPANVRPEKLLRFENCRQVLIRDCDFYGQHNSGIEMRDCDSIHMDQVHIRYCAEYALMATRTTHCLLEYCIIDHNEFAAWSSGNDLCYEFNDCKFFGHKSYLLRCAARLNHCTIRHKEKEICNPKKVELINCTITD